MCCTPGLALAGLSRDFSAGVPAGRAGGSPSLEWDGVPSIPLCQHCWSQHCSDKLLFGGTLGTKSCSSGGREEIPQLKHKIILRAVQ